MPDFEKMYFSLSAKIADAIEILQNAQQECEDAYIEATDKEDDNV